MNNPSSPDFHFITCTTFDNAVNLPTAFIEDQKARAIDSPRHYRRMVLNDFSEDLSDDILFKTGDIEKSSKLNYAIPNFTRYIAGFDIARFGSDKSCLTIIAQVGVTRWRQVFCEERSEYSVPQNAAWAQDVWKMFPFDTIGVDDVGVGGGVTDLLNDTNRFSVVPFIANEAPNGNSPYPSNKEVGYFKLEDWMSREYLQILNDIYLHSELSTIKYYYRNGTKHIVSKEAMRKDGNKSPNKAEALMIAVFCAEYQDVQEVGFEVVPGQSTVKHKDLQQYAITT